MIPHRFRLDSEVATRYNSPAAQPTKGVDILPDSSPPESLSQDQLENIRQLIKLASDNDLVELAVTQPDGLAVKVRTAPETPAPVPMVTYAVPPTGPQGSPEPAATGVTSRNPRAVPLESPMVGTYYRAQTPNDPPFIKEGDIISIGQTIGLIEAMKVYSEIPSELAGKVIEFGAANGQLVQFGQPLVYIEPV